MKPPDGTSMNNKLNGNTHRSKEVKFICEEDVQLCSKEIWHFPKMSCHWHSRQWMHLHFMRLLQQIKLLCCCQTDQDNVSLTSCCVRFCTAIIAHNTEMQHIVWMELTWDFCDVFWQGCSSDIRIVLCNHTGKLLISQTTPRCCWLFETIILAIYFGKS